MASVRKSKPASGGKQVVPHSADLGGSLAADYHARWRAWEKHQPTSMWNEAWWATREEQYIQRRALHYGKDGGQGPQQINLSLWRGDTTLQAMHWHVTHHPVVIQSSVEILTKEGDTHESLFKYKFEVLYGFSLTIGYSRHKDGGIESGRTHAWAAFGANCTTKVRKEVAVDLLLEFTCHHPSFRHHHLTGAHTKRMWVPKVLDVPHTPAPHRATPKIAQLQPLAEKPQAAEPPPAAAEPQAPKAMEPPPTTEEPPAPKSVEPPPATEEPPASKSVEPPPATEEEPQPLAALQPTPATEEEPQPLAELQPTPATQEEPQPLAGLGVTVALGRWSVHKVAQWFTEEGLPVVATQVLQEGMDGLMIEDVTSADLVDLGVPQDIAAEAKMKLQLLSKKQCIGQHKWSWRRRWKSRRWPGSTNPSQVSLCQVKTLMTMHLTCKLAATTTMGRKVQPLAERRRTRKRRIWHSCAGCELYGGIGEVDILAEE